MTATTRASGGTGTTGSARATTANSNAAVTHAAATHVEAAHEGGDAHRGARQEGRSSRDLAAQMAYLTRVIRAPTIAAVWADLGEQARQENWSHEEYLAVVLARQVAAREANGTAIRTAGAHFPAVKTLEDFNLDHQPSLRRDVLAHLATCTFVPTAGNVILLGPPGVGKSHLAIGLGIKAVQAGHPVLFDTATGWVTRLRTAHHEGRLSQELRRLHRYQLLIIDEIGYIPFDADAANLFFQLISSRYEQGSVLATSNMPFSRWGEIFGDDVVAAAMIDRLVHHAEVLTLTGDSYRTRNRRDLIAKDPATTHRNT
jgi:DNA replication protein DnaC